jgi:hypothetical protein
MQVSRRTKENTCPVVYNFESKYNSEFIASICGIFAYVEERDIKKREE